MFPSGFARAPTLLFLASLALLLSVAVAFAEPADEHGESQPRLILPGEGVIQTGQLVSLRWSPADSVSELEILLSTDGGRTYSRCISPQLDPRRCEFVWRVPEVGSGSVRMRIRFNRRGLEIEGAPSVPLRVFAGGKNEAEPLALPPFNDAEAPRPPSRGEAPVSGSALGSLEASDQPSHSCSALETSRVIQPKAIRIACPYPRHIPGLAVQFVPLRT